MTTGDDRAGHRQEPAGPGEAGAIPDAPPGGASAARPARWTRRRFLGAAGTGLLVAAAGAAGACLTSGTDNSDSRSGGRSPADNGRAESAGGQPPVQGTARTASAGHATPAPTSAPANAASGPLGPLPRWRGFNLQGMYDNQSTGDFAEEDFGWMAEWGFDFVRLPLCYTFWAGEADPLTVREERLEKLDRAVELGRKNGLHVMLSLHKAPGYSIDGAFRDPFFTNLWKEPAAESALAFHWGTLARRYRALPADALSFNPINEPPWPDEERMTEADHLRVMESVMAAVRAESPDRRIVLDGLRAGTQPVAEFTARRLPQALRAYAPTPLTHYKASWSNYKEGPEPDWPLTTWGEGVWGRGKLAEYFRPWLDLADDGVGVHCSEEGAYRHTPHETVLRWLQDVLEILTNHGIGLALWEFRGGFGVLDSERADVPYEDWHGHRLDRKMLELLREFR